MASRSQFSDRPRSNSRHYDYDMDDHRRHDSSVRSKNDSYNYVTPSDSYNYVNLSDSSRYYYPPPSSYHKSRKHTSWHRENPQWPPPPKVEEEKVALAKEFQPQHVASDDEACSRGSIDQDPIIQDIPEFIQDRRFVLVSSDSKSAKVDVSANSSTSTNTNTNTNTKSNTPTPTPPTSDDEVRRRGRRKAPRVETVGLPEMGREPSPYSWTKPTPTPPSNKRFSGDTFLSPDTIFPSLPSRFASAPRDTTIPTRTPTTATPEAPASAPRNAPTSVLNNAPTSTSTTNHTSAPFLAASNDQPRHHTTRRRTSSQTASSHAQAGTTSSEEEYVRSRPVGQRKRLSTSHARHDKDNGAISYVEDFAYGPASQSSKLRDSESSPLPQQDLPGRYSKPAPPRTTSYHSRNNSDGRSSYDSLQEPSRQASSGYSPSPPRSPRPYVERQREAPVMPSSRPGSQASSAYSSPQPSPQLSKSSLAADAAWGSLAAASAAAALHQPKQPSRLTSTTLADPTSTPRAPANQRPVQRNSSLPYSSERSYSLPYPVEGGTSLPYPDEDKQFESMPSERDHQYIHPEQRNVLQSPIEQAKPTSRMGMPSDSMPIPGQRPPLPSRNNTAPVSPTSPRTVRPLSSGTSSRPKTAAQLKLLARSLPPCSRQEYSRMYDDWFTLEGCPDFDICPECLERVFGDTLYRCYFKRSPNRTLIRKGLQVKCDFGDAWVRLAWLLTVQRELPSLDLIKTLINLSPPNDSDEACPGSEEAVRSWYSVRDRSGHFLRRFAVCSADVRRLQILFPGFRDLWQPLPLRSSYSYGEEMSGLRRACSMRPACNNRFPLYIDTLVRLHEPAFEAGRMPDASDFVSLVRHKNQVHECRRDNMIRDGEWHFIPSLLPAFTVCEDCYDEVVLPAVEADADVAMRFNRVAQRVNNEGRLGSSCQLYSSRMRRVFRQAIRDNDLKYLGRKSMDRKDAEDELQERSADVHRQARRIRRVSGGGGNGTQMDDELFKLQKEAKRLLEQWAHYE